MSMLIAHEDTAFENQTVYMTGHAYKRCSFDGCTLVMRNGVGAFTECRFDRCSIHVDFLVHDAETANALMSHIGFMRQMFPAEPNPENN